MVEHALMMHRHTRPNHCWSGDGVTFNYAEILGKWGGNGSRRFVLPPRQERDNLGEFFERMGMEIRTDAVGNIFTEFWPDINQKFFHQR